MSIEVGGLGGSLMMTDVRQKARKMGGSVEEFQAIVANNVN